MSLFRQIALALSLFFAVTLVTVMWLNFKTANEFVQNQLYSDARDTANSLGLSLSKVADPADLSSVEAMMNAIFDSGYYQDMVLKDPDGNILIEKRNKKAVLGVPQWFINGVDIKVAEAKSEIMMGWIPFGSLEIRSHLGHAYIQLWSTLIDISRSFLILALVIFTSLHFMLKLILRSLVDIKKQAEAIQNNDFIIQEGIPFTTDFRSVVAAMNQMVSKVKDIFDKEAATLKKYNDLLYIDQDTGLGNRNFLDINLKNYTNNSSGVFLLLEIKDDASLKKFIGFNKFFGLLKFIILAVKESDALGVQSVFARINTGSFAIVLPNQRYENIEDKVGKIYEKIQEYANEQNLGENFLFAIGATEFIQQDEVRKILTRADKGVSAAFENTETNKISFVKNDAQTKTKQEWVELLEWAFANDGVKIGVQDIVDATSGTVYLREFSSRMSDSEGKIYFPGDYMPIAKEMGWFLKLEKFNIQKIFELQKAKNIGEALVVNLSNEFIKDASTSTWLFDELSRWSKDGARFYFACLNGQILKDIDYYIAVSKELRRLGHKLVVDSFSFEGSSLEYLKNLKPAAIKISKSYLLSKDDVSISAGSVQNIAMAIGSNVVVKHVESQNESELLTKNGFKYVQGYLVGKVKVID